MSTSRSRSACPTCGAASFPLWRRLFMREPMQCRACGGRVRTLTWHPLRSARSRPWRWLQVLLAGFTMLWLLTLPYVFLKGSWITVALLAVVLLTFLPQGVGRLEAVAPSPAAPTFRQQLAVLGLVAESLLVFAAAIGLWICSLNLAQRHGLLPAAAPRRPCPERIASAPGDEKPAVVSCRQRREDAPPKPPAN